MHADKCLIGDIADVSGGVQLLIAHAPDIPFGILDEFPVAIERIEIERLRTVVVTGYSLGELHMKLANSVDEHGGPPTKLWTGRTPGLSFGYCELGRIWY